MKLPPEVNLLAVAPLPAGARHPAEGATRRSPSSAAKTPEHPEPRRRRRRQRDQPRQPGHAQHGEAVQGEGRSSRRSPPSCSRSTSPTWAPMAGLLHGLARVRRGRDELPRRPRPAARRQGDEVRPARRHHHRRPGEAHPQIESWEDEYFTQNVTESSRTAWYDGDWAKRPSWKRRPCPSFTATGSRGSQRPRSTRWVKAPRLDGKPDAGRTARPGARRLPHGPRSADREVGDQAPRHRRGDRQGRSSRPAMLHSTLGRHAARAIRCAMLGELSLKHWRLLVENIGKGDTAIFNDPMPSCRRASYRGVGFHEAPRGTLSHWCVIDDGKSSRTTRPWCPRPGTPARATRRTSRAPTRRRLVGNPVADPRSCRSRRCAPSTPSIPASPAPSTRSTPRGTRSRG